MRLSVFPGGFNTARALQVCGVSLPSLKILVDQFLLQPSANSSFRMHDLLRQFTRENLDAHPEEALALQRQFAHAYLDALAGWSARLKSDEQLQVLAEMNLEQDNFRLAWEWAILEEGLDISDQALDGICRYFYLYCRYQEGSTTCRQSEQSIGVKHSFALHAGLRRWQAAFLNLQGDRQPALQIIEPLVEELQTKVLTSPGLRGELAAAGLVLADIQYVNPTLATMELAQQSLRLYRSLERPWDIARALCTLTAVHDHLGNRLECYSTAQEALEILEQGGDPYLVALGKSGLSYCYMLSGEYELALGLVQDLAAYYRRVGDRYSESKAKGMLIQAYFYAGLLNEARATLSQYYEDVRAPEVFIKMGVHMLGSSMGLQDAALDLYCGRYDDAFTKAEVGGRDSDYNYPLCQAIIGVVYTIHEDLAQSVKYLEQSRTIYRHFIRQDHTGWPLTFLSLVFYRMKEHQKSRSYLIEALEYAEKYPVISVTCLSLATLALFLAEGGKIEEAVEIYAAVITHPLAKNSALFDDLFQKKINALAADLPPEVIDQARQRGNGQNLRDLVHKYRQQLIDNPDFCP